MPGIGCDPKLGWEPVSYKGIYVGGASTRPYVGSVPVDVRAAASPYICAMRATDGSLNFESTRYARPPALAVECI